MSTTLKRFDWEPSWLKTTSIKYQFKTVILKSPTFKEQRRSIYPTPNREEKVDFLLYKESVVPFLNNCREYSLCVIAVPIFIEPLKPTGTIFGQYTISFVSDLTKYWNVNNNCHVFLLKSPTLSELKEKQIIGSSSITFKTFVAQNFDSKDTLVYPCFTGIIKSFQQSVETDSLLSAELEFQEIFLDWTL